MLLTDRTFTRIHGNITITMLHLARHNKLIYNAHLSIFCVQKLCKVSYLSILQVPPSNSTDENKSWRLYIDTVQRKLRSDNFDETFC